MFRIATSNERALPWSGVVAYLTTLYVWLLASLQPLFLFFVPVLHSLQYLTVVWRFEYNRQLASDGGRGFIRQAFGDTATKRFARFVLIGVFLGYMGFHFIPENLKTAIDFNKNALSGFVFLFMVWILINTHHYFIDNVIWRRENPEMRDHLFSHTH